MRGILKKGCLLGRGCLSEILVHRKLNIYSINILNLDRHFRLNLMIEYERHLTAS